MKKNISTKLSDYIPYPFLIPKISIDFNIGKNEVVVLTSMIIEPKTKETTKLVLKGTCINLLSISINDRELKFNEFNLSENDLIILNTPSSRFKLNIKSKICIY